jgi:ubiquinone/menaquinone biosynthesis C-methylase UbiE
MQAVLNADDVREANTRYHDVAASRYDFKWGIDFGRVGQAQVRSKLRKLVGGELDRGYGEALEIGAGTGYFSLNLLQSATVRAATCTDISPGMLRALEENADRLGLSVQTERADAEELPFADESFDLVLGHAVLHHLPGLGRAFAEVHRVLRPGGMMVFAGEPSRFGDRLARVPKRAGVWAAPLWRAILRCREARPPDAGAEDADHELEQVVDIHAFTPEELGRYARSAGFTDVGVRGEELLANWFGWFNRALEASADPDDVPMFWRQYAFHGYLVLQRIDERLLEPVLPPALFYNLLLAARKP